jgi:bifunctional non-homologous end joining protein LigD
VRLSATKRRARPRWLRSLRASGASNARPRSPQLAKAGPGLRLNEHLEHKDGDVVFRHACQLGLEGIVSKRLGSRYTSGRSRDWLKMKNPAAPAVKREAEEDWDRR